MYSIQPEEDRDFILEYIHEFSFDGNRTVKKCTIPTYDPTKDTKTINPDEKSDESEYISANDQKKKIQAMMSQLPTPDQLKEYGTVYLSDSCSFHIQPLEFEKDDDSNHHIDFITAASNLRATK